MAKAAARAVRMEQQFEDDILEAAVKSLSRDRGNVEKTVEDVRIIGDLLQRDKRAVDLLGGLLGGGAAVVSTLPSQALGTLLLRV